MQIIHHHLKTIPDYLKVSEVDIDDARISFILDSYQELIVKGVPLPELTPDTTFKEIKDNLDQASIDHTREVMDFIVSYNNNFLGHAYGTDMDKKTAYKYLTIFGFAFLVIIILFTMLYLSLTGDTGLFTNVFNRIIGIMGEIFTSFAGDNPPPM